MKLTLMSPHLWRIVLVVSFFTHTLIPVSAATVSVIIEGTISPSENVDVYDLDNASFSAHFIYDTESPSTSLTGGIDAWITNFQYVSTNIILTNRPNGASDTTTSVSPDSALQLGLRNSFGSSNVLDLIHFRGDLTDEFEGLNISLLFAFDQNYFPFGQIPNLSDFVLLDGIASPGGSLFFSEGAIAMPFHRVTAFSNISATAVPLPSSLLLFLSAVALLRLRKKGQSSFVRYFQDN